MKKALEIFIGLLIISNVNGQELSMTPLGPKASDKSEVISEFRDFIIYKGDTLNRRDDSGLKSGEWIEYRKAYLQRTNGATTKTDSTSVSYVIEMRGNYVGGKKNGLWNSFYRDGRIKESMKYN